MATTKMYRWLVTGAMLVASLGVTILSVAADPTTLAPMCGDEGSVEGTITAEQIVGPAAQGIAAGQLREFIRAPRARAGYLNVHTERVPSGEIRGQIR